MKKYIIKLSDGERVQLQNITGKGTHNARVITRARIMVSSDAGLSDSLVALRVETTSKTVQRVRARYGEGGIERALYDAPRPGTPRTLNDTQEANLVAIACSDPPEGRKHWTIELLRTHLNASGIKASIGTVHATLTERGVKPWREKNVVRGEHYA